MRSYPLTFILATTIIVVLIAGCQQSTKQESDNSSLPAIEEKATESRENNIDTASIPRETRASGIRVSHNIDTILGAWIRPDGNYILEIIDINEDMSLEANYYNPRPINISMAQLKKEDKIKIFVEFDDVNYKGSYYDLQYDPVNDALTGNYYQATYGQTYPIAFIRYEIQNQ